ncbi:unnamed protein product [marine sediment metagenome]|uniref:Uncharacterized protein n=1 Tax=marine sediment metagenome TaxID=412755 RepID=X0UKE2_9ZZZZ
MNRTRLIRRTGVSTVFNGIMTSDLSEYGNIILKLKTNNQ